VIDGAVWIEDQFGGIHPVKINPAGAGVNYWIARVVSRPKTTRMRKIYHLSTCSTNQRIIRELGGLAGFELQDIKSQPLTAGQLDEMKKMAGSYEMLFSRRALKYKEMGLKDKSLSEKDYRKLILDEYTFLKRPVIIVDDRIFVGNAASEVAAAKQAIGRRRATGTAKR